MNPGILTPALYLFAMVVTLAAGYRVYRQALMSYLVVRDFLIWVYVLIFGLLALELWRVLGGSFMGMTFYAPASIGIGLVEAVLLCSAAVGLYLKPVGSSSYRTFLADLRKSRLHTILFGTFSAFALTVVVYISVFHPYTIQTVSLLGGGSALAMVLPFDYVFLLLGVLTFFLAYPALLLYIVAVRTKDPYLRGSLWTLPIGWAGSTLLYVVFESLLWGRLIDATAVMYFGNSVLFFYVTRNFRHAAIIAGLVSPTGKRELELAAAGTDSEVDVSSLGGRPALILADPRHPFETMVSGIVTTSIAQGIRTFVFTSRGSRVDKALGDIQPLNRYLLTPTVSSYKAGSNGTEVFLSSENASIILDAFGKIVRSGGEGKTAVIFDNVSDLIMSLGFIPTYRFLGSCLELGADSRVSCFFILLNGVQEAQAENAIVGKFPVILSTEQSGLRIVKTPR